MCAVFLDMLELAKMITYRSVELIAKCLMLHSAVLNVKTEDRQTDGQSCCRKYRASMQRVTR